MAVKVEHLWKTFQIPHERRTTLFENLAGMMMPRQYETFAGLKDVSFEVDECEFVGIIGDNGSGKSTLLKIIANILRPTKGTINVKGKMTPFLELGVGFQPDLTVKENIGVYATVMGLSRREIKERRDEVIEFAGLENFEDTKLKNLSSGMQVRLAFSTAIQTKPDVLLVDEVLAVGDMEFQQKCFDVFDRYRKEGVTILFVSHDLGAVRKFCDKTLLLKNGEVVSYGETNYVIDKYIYKQGEINAETSATGTNEEKKTRWGNNKIEILGAKFLDKNGMDNSNFISMDTMTVRILYDSHEKVYAPVFGIVFYLQDTYCYGTTTEFGGCNIGTVFGKGHVDFTIEKLPLQTGKFEVTVAVADSNCTTAYDWHDRLYSFKVHNPTRDLGIFHIEGDWSVEKDA
jgi:lipopolysaccharide transport system ATP-binding protein